MHTRFADAVRELRLKEGPSRSRFGRKVGVDPMTIYHWEKTGRVASGANLARLIELGLEWTPPALESEDAA